jgi:hypothetical protein
MHPADVKDATDARVRAAAFGDAAVLALRLGAQDDLVLGLAGFAHGYAVRALSIEALPHTQDEQCDVDPITLCCRDCGVDHAGDCYRCDGRGFHKDACPLSDAAMAVL